MKRLFLFCALVLVAVMAAAQGSVRGRVLDKQADEAMQYVNVKVVDAQGKLVRGGVTDVKGSFRLAPLPYGNYTLQVSFVGYKPLERHFVIGKDKLNAVYSALYMSEDATVLKEVQVTGQRSQMKLEVDRKTFTVDEVLAAAGGSVSDLLENIPSVEVTTDGEISLRGNSSVEVWINGKSSGLTTDNRAEILQQIPAESIERIEVIDNPSAKYSPEGTAGIINIVMKRDRRAGYYGSLQAGANQKGGWNVGGNINYSSKWVDAFANVGYRKRKNSGDSEGEHYFKDAAGQVDSYQIERGDNDNNGGGLFARGGLTFHLSQADDLTLQGMAMVGTRKNDGLTTYRYGTTANGDDRLMSRHVKGDDDSHMVNAELGYIHKFDAEGKHKIDFSLSFNKWKSDGNDVYRSDTTYISGAPATFNEQLRPLNINNRSWEVKLDYENQITPNIKLEAGYNGNFSHENTPQDAKNWDAATGTYVDDPYFFNTFVYDNDIHALYATGNFKLGHFGVMAGLRGEYWRVDTRSGDYYGHEEPFKKDYFQLFPSLFLNYELTPTAQIQLNYTRRLRRPWGGELNSFKNTRDAAVIEFGNPELTPEYTHSLALNFLKTWPEHTLSIGTYYRPTTDVIQRIHYQGKYDGQTTMFQTNLNVAKSQRAGAELILKDKLWKILDLTTTVNAYYYKLNDFSTLVDGQLVTGKSDENFAWDARVLASVLLPYNISFQATGRYRSRSVVTQGYRKANGSLDLGVRKTFFNKMFSLALNWRDVFKSRCFENFTEGPTFRIHEKHRHDTRVNLQLTWNFGNMKQKRKPAREEMQGDDDGGSSFGGYDR